MTIALAQLSSDWLAVDDLFLTAVQMKPNFSSTPRCHKEVTIHLVSSAKSDHIASCKP